jgi:acetyltransferase
VVRRSPPSDPRRQCSIVLATDRVFGPVIGIASPADRIDGPNATMLAPLNRRLALDLLANAGIRDPGDALVYLLLRISGIACALPWVRQVIFDHIGLGEQRLAIPVARILVDPAQAPQPGYRHMAIHPYPVEYETVITTADGTKLDVRPIRPEDVELERRFIASLSEQTRFFRFFYRLHELSPSMLARFTQVDYDRELALLALHADPEAPDGAAVVGIARFIATSDRDSAEFAIVVGDAWHGRGVGVQLMQALIAAARDRGLRRLVGTVLRENHAMLRFSRGLGFTVTDDPDDTEQLCLEIALG